MVNKEVTVLSEVGLCAKPASHFIRTANEFESRIKVFVEGGSSANGKSLLSVLALGIKKGGQITISAEGADEQAAIDKLTDQIENCFYL